MFDGETIEVVALEGNQAVLVPVGAMKPDPTSGIAMKGDMYFQGWDRLKGKCTLGVKYGFWTRDNPESADTEQKMAGRGGDIVLPPSYVYKGSPFRRKPWKDGYSTYGPPSQPSSC